MRGFQDATELINDEIYKAKDLEDAKKMIEMVHACVNEFRLQLIAETIFYYPGDFQGNKAEHPSSEKKTETAPATS